MNILEHKGIRVLVGIVLACLAIFLVAETRTSLRAGDVIGHPDAVRDTITLGAEGKVTGIPDVATASIGVLTEQRTVTAAQEGNTEKMNAIIAEMKSLGIDEKDIRTQTYEVYPVYDWRDGQRVDRGFAVNQTIEVKIREMAKSGDVLALAARLGANQVGGLTFIIDDPEALEQEARLEAIAKAQEKAVGVADAAGIRLGKLVGISENTGVASPVYRAYALDGAGLGGSSPEIAQGSQDIIVYVSATYEVLP